MNSFYKKITTVTLSALMLFSPCAVHASATEVTAGSPEQCVYTVDNVEEDSVLASNPKTENGKEKREEEKGKEEENKEENKEKNKEEKENKENNKEEKGNKENNKEEKEKVSQEKPVTTYQGKVKAAKLRIYKKKSSHSKVLKTYKKGHKLTLLNIKQKWIKVKLGSSYGYALGKDIKYYYGTAQDPYANTINGWVAVSEIKLKKKKSQSSSTVCAIKKDTKVTILTPGKKWVKVEYKNMIGYALGKKITIKGGAKASSQSAAYAAQGLGGSIVALALKYLGGRYVWGGSTLGRGVDCSGFIMALYRKFGKSLPHSSSAMRRCGRSVGGISNAHPGDIVCYSGHVALYMGNGKVIHASNPSSGIKISNVGYRSYVAIRRIF